MKEILIPIFILFCSFSSQCQIKRALFIGNSYTYYNSLPRLVADMASSTGNTLIHDCNAMSNYSLKEHYSNYATLESIRRGCWDFVVLQEQSQNPSEPLTFVNENVYPYAQSLDSEINSYNAGAETVFYMTWGRKNGDASRCGRLPEVCTYIGMDELTRERYRVMASANQAMVSPVGAVWRYIRNNYPSVELYNPDESHPSVAGSYAAACCFYTVFFRKDPSLITYNHTLNPTEAANIRNAARAVVYDNLMFWHIGEYDSDSQAPSVPTGLAYSSLSETGFTLSWNASADNIGVTGYDVYQNNSWKMHVTFTSAAIHNLNPSASYAMKVTARDAAGNTSGASSILYVTTPDNHPPGTPTGLTAADLSETGFTLKWNKSCDNAGVSGYNVYRNSTWISFVADTFACIQGLKVFTTYTMTVKAKDAAGNISPVSNALSVTTTDTHRPSSPKGLTSDNIAETRFNLRWKAANDNVGVTGYNVYQNCTQITSVTDTFAVISGLNAFTSYAMTVKAKDGAGNVSFAGDTLLVTTSDLHPPAIPSGLASGNLAETGFTLSWTTPEDNVGIAGYDIYQNDSWIIAVADTFACIQGLNAFTTYAMTLTAKDAAGNVSGTSEPLLITTPDIHEPAIPSPPDLTSLTDTSIALHWSSSADNVGVAGYDIYLDTVHINFVTDTLAVITGLKAFTPYAITIKAKDVAGNMSSACNALYVKTTDTRAPSKPSKLVTHNLQDTGFTLKWAASNDNAGIAAYHVYKDGTWTHTVADTLIEMNGLESSVGYVMTIKARDYAGNMSAASNALVVTTPDTKAPTVPTGLAVHNLTENSFTLGWLSSMDNVGVTGYNIYQDGIWISAVVDAYAEIGGLTMGTTYTMTVTAKDTAGNASDVSSPLLVTTLITLLSPCFSDSILIYPNPVVAHEFCIETGWGDISNATVEVTDCKGKILYKHKVEITGPVITVSGIDWPDGLYILRLYDDKTIVNRKILINKN